MQRNRGKQQNGKDQQSLKENYRFKGLDLVDRMHEGLWTEVCNIVQEAVIKTIAKKKKCNKARWLSEEALQIAKKTRERQRRNGKIYPIEYRVPENSKER